MVSKLRQPTYEDTLRGINSANATLDLDLIIHGLVTREDVREYLSVLEHDKFILSQLYNVYLYKPSDYVYEGCWESEKDFATNLADSNILPSKDVPYFANYFDYESFTYDLFITDYTSLDCNYCGDLIIARYD